MSELCYEDDTQSFGKNGKGLQHNINGYIEELEKYNMKVNIDKTKTTIIGAANTQHQNLIKIDGQRIEQIGRFTYLIKSKSTLDDKVNQRLPNYSDQI